MGIPLSFILIVVNVVLFSWLAHVLHAVFTDSLDHMSLFEWTEKLYFLAKNTIDKILEVISISL
jgi:hypothetical protein